MFINLSNHPSAKWKTEQIEAASVYGDIEDIPFPDIPPDWDTEKVESLANNYFEKCINQLAEQGKKSAIHIAGEPVFCFTLIQKLLKAGYTVLTSTSKRIVNEVENKKISVFIFVKFRNYKLQP